MKVTTLDKPTIRSISADMNKALQSVASKYGITIGPKGGSFTESNATIKFECAIISSKGVMTKERMEWMSMAKYTGPGLKTEWLDETFMYGGHEYKITGLATRGQKRPVLVTKVSNGKGFKFKCDTIIQAMTNQ